MALDAVTNLDETPGLLRVCIRGEGPGAAIWSPHVAQSQMPLERRNVLMDSGHWTFPGAVLCLVVAAGLSTLAS